MSAKGKPRAPLAAFLVGTICPSADQEDAEDSKMLALTSYRPRTLDLGKLDGLSPPWMRLSSKPGHDPEARPAAYVSQYAKLLSSYLLHKAESSSAKLEAMPGWAACRPKITVKALSDPKCPGQIAVACVARFEPAQGGEGDAKARAAELASAWGSLFLRSATLPLSKGGSAEWAACPAGLPRAVMSMLINGGMGGAEEALSQWAPALLAHEQSLAIGAVKPSKRKSARKAPPRRKGL